MRSWNAFSVGGSIKEEEVIFKEKEKGFFRGFGDKVRYRRLEVW